MNPCKVGRVTSSFFLALSLLPVAIAQRTLTAKVVALDQAFYNNRLGSFQAGGMIFALRGDVVSNDPVNFPTLTAGHVMLRPDKRARPIVLRMNSGDCLAVEFENLLANVPSYSPPPPPLPFQPSSLKTQPDPNPVGSTTSQSATRLAGVHVMGTESKESIEDDSSWIGANPNGLVAPGQSHTYTFCGVGKSEGVFLLYSTAANIGYADSFGGQLMQGLFGSLMIEPPTAEYYRSQVTKAELDAATYVANKLPTGMTLAPKGSPQQTFTTRGKTYSLWTLSGGSLPAAVDVTETNVAGDPVTQGGLLKTRDLHPMLNYQAQDASGKPILSMLKDGEIVHSDLTAIITGPNAGRFHPDNPSPTFLPNPVYPDRFQPFREFSIHYHDDPLSTQAFPEFGPLPANCQGAAPTGKDCGVWFALQAARDFFAINYGMAAIGPEVWANRIHVGPMEQCATCKFEEFFLSSWAVSDPAMVVDFPANNGLDKDGNVTSSHVQATKALYPDDPSNVYHSYMGDHVVFRIVHAGANITHVHHQHAHQWLHSPNSDESDYRDSQMLSPGGSYTLDMSYFGSGNLNQTVGDSIFHCHFYPHFAQGMWSFWRVHDVFEEGTKLDSTGTPTLGWNRSLPDGEITAGTPIPAIVPMPTRPMAPEPIRAQVCPVYGASDYVKFTGNSCPASPVVGAAPVGYKSLVSQADLDDTSLTEKNPGYPFFVPGVAGQRPPHPPLDFAPEEDDKGVQEVVNGVPQYLDGGLPRAQFLAEKGKLYEKHNAWDFTKENDKLVGVEVPEEGTSVEKVAMAVHAIRKHPTVTPEGQPGDFILNGQSPKPGAPFADPAIDVDGKPIPNSDCSKHESGCVRYKAADIQMDVVLNKKGWHYPQQRIVSLWGDVKPNLDGTRRPEPLFFRANSDQVVEYWLANLVPTNYELDDFQVRTPTDIIGQHIHLVKFDVTSSDGAGNGYNYEDGTFSNEEVVGLIGNVNGIGGLYSADGVTQKKLTPKGIPYFDAQFPGSPGTHPTFLGAQATIQRWYADPIKDNAGQDRTMRTVFTHDHFGPSTHQQVGLYAGLVVEPQGSKWFDSTTGYQLGTRFDGGPTTFQANINVPDSSKSYREFMLEFQDRQLAYTSNSISAQKPYERYGPDYPGHPNPGGYWGWADPANAINAPAAQVTTPPLIPGGPPTPDLITNQMSEGAFSLNYANEPLPWRINPTPTPAVAAAPNATDLADAFLSIPRTDPALNCQPAAGAPINPQPNCATSTGTGFKYAPPFPGADPDDPYTPLLRAYEGDNVQIRNLVGAHMAPHSFHIHGLNWQFEPAVDSSGFRSTQGMGISEHYEFLFHMPTTGTGTGTAKADYLYMPTSDDNGTQYGQWGLLRGYRVPDQVNHPLPDLVPLAKTQQIAFPGSKPMPAPEPAFACPAYAPKRSFAVTAVYAPIALNGPLVYNSRPSHGETQNDPFALMYVMTADLNNGVLKSGVPQEPLILRAAAGDCITLTLTNALPTSALNKGIAAAANPFPTITLETSHQVGIHPQLLAYDVTQGDGFNIGENTPRTAPPGQQVTYTWYAGKIMHDAGGASKYVPVEFGAIDLTPVDPLMQDNFGLIGALIVEPQNSSWTVDQNTRAGATVTMADKTVFREGVAIVQDDVASLGGAMAFNYRTEPFSYRYVNQDYLENDPALSPLGISRAQSDTLVSGDPQTPVFVSGAGTPFRLRALHPAGLNEQVFELHGHGWQEEPYSKGSLQIASYNPLSQWTGSRDTFGANSSFDAILAHAGGSHGVKGDYLFRTFIAQNFQGGMWGLLRVGEPGKDVVTITTFCAAQGSLSVDGVNTVNPSNGLLATSVTITGPGLTSQTVPVNQSTGLWQATFATAAAPATITVTSTQGGVSTAATTLCPIQPTTPAPTQKPVVNSNDDVNRFLQQVPTLSKPNPNSTPKQVPKPQ